jgi:HlyD family secretion protein
MAAKKSLKRLGVGHYGAVAVVLAVTTAGGYVGFERLAPKPVAAARVNTADVTRGSIISTVSATGSVAAPTQSKLSFRTGGRLAQLFVAVGDRVEEGKPLARLDDSDLVVALSQAQANYRSAVAKLEQTRAGAKAEDVAIAQSQLDSARLKLEQTRAVTKGPDMVSAQSQLESAKIKLNQLLAGPRAEDLAAAQSQLEAAQARLAALSNPRPEDLASAQSQLENARIKLTQLQTPRPEDVRTAEASLVTAKLKLNALLNPRPEDLASAQNQLDGALTRYSQIVDQPRTAKPEDIANAELSVKNAQVNYDKAVADAGARSSTTTQAAADASVKQALISLEQAQNNLTKIKSQGPTEWEIRLAQQSVESAQAAMNKLRNPSPVDVQTAQASVDQAQSTLDKLLNPNPFDLQAAQESVRAAEASLNKIMNPSAADVASAQQSVFSAKSALEKLLAPTEFDLQAAQQAVVSAQASYDKFLNSNGYDVQTAQLALAQQQLSFELKKAGPAAVDILTAEASVEQAQAAVKKAEADLAGATLIAPFTGHVSVLAFNLGEQVGAGTAAITLVDTRQARIDVVVDETDVAKIQVGQTVNVTFEALPGQTMTGKVAMVAPVATVQQGVVNYPVQIAVEPGQNVTVRPGMTASARVVTQQRENTVVAPNRAVRTVGRNRVVEVLGADGKTEQRQVRVGLANDQQTEILEGVQPGELLVIPGTTTAAPRIGGAPGGNATFGGPAPAGGNQIAIRR